MKRFLCKFLLMIPAILFLLICEYKYRSINNNYKYKNNWLTENAATVQILSLGSSHAYSGIISSEFCMKTFNASHLLQDLHYDYFIFDKFYDQLTSLEYLILPVSYMTPFLDLDASSESWRAHFYGLYYGCREHQREPLYNVRIFNHVQFERAVYYLFHPYSEKTCRTLGEKNGRCDIMVQDLDESGRSRAEGTSYRVLNWQLYKTNKQRAENIIQLCRDRCIKVILLTTPVCDSYRKHIRKPQLEAMIAFCDSLESRYDNVVYLNFWDDSRFDRNDFADADHLSCDKGGVKLSLILNDYIMLDANQ